MKNKIITNIIVTVLVVLGFLTTAFASDSDDILDVLDSYHKAAEDGDVQEYINTLEIEFYEYIMPEDEEYSEYVRGTFEIIDTLSYSINSPSVRLHNDDTALVFYNFEAEIKDVSTDESKDINNDMVAFFVKVDGEWKLRWNILHTLYEYKIGADVVNDYYIENMVELVEEKTLKEIGIEEGILVEVDEDIMENTNQVDSYTPTVSNSKTSSSYNNYDDNSNLDDSEIYSDYSNKNDYNPYSYDSKNSDSDSKKTSSTGYSQKDYDNYYNKHYNSNYDDDDSGISWYWYVIGLVVLIWLFSPAKKKENNNNINKNNSNKKSSKSKVSKKTKTNKRRNYDINKDQQYNYQQEMAYDEDMSRNDGGDSGGDD